MIPNEEKSLKFSDKDKANILQKQFLSVFTNEPPGDLPHFPDRCPQQLKLELTQEMVIKEIEQLDETKSMGPDEIHPKMLKKLKDEISTPLTALMKKSLKQGVLPNDWKVAHITPIFKKGAKNLAVNYRPISLTSIVGKIMERIVKRQTMKHLSEHNLISSRQYGFINGRSTTTQLLTFLDNCAEAIAKNDVIDTIYFDFAKAFDSVPHERLLKKISAYGLKG